MKERHLSVGSSTALTVSTLWGCGVTSWATQGDEGKGRQGGKLVEGGKTINKGKQGVEGCRLSLLLAMHQTAVLVPRGSYVGPVSVSLKAAGGWSWGSAHSSKYNTAVLCLCLGYNKKAIKCEMS